MIYCTKSSVMGRSGRYAFNAPTTNDTNNATTLGNRLINDYNVNPDDIACYMSGNKGFHIVLQLDHEITPEQFKQATVTLAHGLDTFDLTVSDPQRILRAEYTQHPKSGLYKIPLHIAEVAEELNIDEIKDLAKTSREDYNHNISPVSLPKKLFEIKETKKKENLNIVNMSLDLTKKPKHFQDYVYSKIGRAHV